MQTQASQHYGAYQTQVRNTDVWQRIETKQCIGCIKYLVYNLIRYIMKRSCQRAMLGKPFQVMSINIKTNEVNE